RKKQQRKKQQRKKQRRKKQRRKKLKARLSQSFSSTVSANNLSLEATPKFGLSINLKNSFQRPIIFLSQFTGFPAFPAIFRGSPQIITTYI
ncbi:MAG: hypothetical protein JSU88_09055, partial [Nitrospinaceae bacterium]